MVKFILCCLNWPNIIWTFSRWKQTWWLQTFLVSCLGSSFNVWPFRWPSFSTSIRPWSLLSFSKKSLMRRNQLNRSWRRQQAEKTPEILTKVTTERTTTIYFLNARTLHLISFSINTIAVVFSDGTHVSWLNSNQGWWLSGKFVFHCVIITVD